MAYNDTPTKGTAMSPHTSAAIRMICLLGIVAIVIENKKPKQDEK